MAVYSYNSIDSDFKKQTERLNRKNKSVKWSDSDFKFLQYLRGLYGDALSTKGLNNLDPVYANMFHYNKMGMRGDADFPRVSRTYVFFTRPELNWSYETIHAIPFFQWLYSKPVGKMVMAALTDPDYFLNCPTALNAMDANQLDKYKEAFNEFAQKLKEAQHNSLDDYGGGEIYNNGGNAPDSFDDDKTKELMDMDFSSLEEQPSIFEDGSGDYLSSNYKSLNDKAWQTESQNDNYFLLLDQVAAELEKIHESPIDANLTDSFHKASELLVQTHPGLESDGDQEYRFNYTSPFIPLLSNTCIELTGAKDLNLETFDYEEDERAQKQTVATGMDEFFSGGTFNTNHEDIKYGPVSFMYLAWIFYIHYVSRGYITTTRTHVIERILDYTSSAYVFVIGEDGRTIQRFGRFTGCYPTSFPLSSQLEHRANPAEDMLQKVSITWHYDSFEALDPLIFKDFNFLSESEWLFKLRYYYRAYSDGEVDSTLLESETDNDFSESELKVLHSYNRSSRTWVPVKNPGMSGQVPRPKINGTDVMWDKGKRLTHVNMINNYWGGYPYINNAYEFIWVMPRYKSNGIPAPDQTVANTVGTSLAKLDLLDGKSMQQNTM